MKEAIIVTQSRSLTPGSYMPPIDLEVMNGWRPFKKSRAKKMKDQLETAIKEEQLNFQVNFDYTMGDLEELKLDGVALCILTPAVSGYVESEGLNENEYIVLTEKEYKEAEVRRIIHKMKWLEGKT